VWESIRPVTRAPTVRVFDLDSAELERRWTFYLAALRESISVSGDLPPAARTAALLWGVGAGLWTTPPHELGARIDAVGPPAVIAAIRGLRSAQRVVAQSIDVLSMGGRVSAPIYQHIDPEIRDLAISTYNRILATPEVLCRVNLERIDADQRDWIRTMQAERCTPADTAGGFPLAAGPWALPPPIVPSDTPAGGYGAKLGDPLPGGDGGSMAAAILMGGAVVAAVGFGVFRRRAGKR
jgi:hypothetical protein